ncbi:hypothetical protein HDU86_005575 [Geranomyces michiganensis]|nr:hypothetical protein HDU86_005575 [Geranomyces michiganensis]
MSMPRWLDNGDSRLTEDPEDKFLGTVVRTTVLYQKENGDIYQTDVTKVIDQRGDSMPYDGRCLMLEMPDGTGMSLPLPHEE